MKGTAKFVVRLRGKCNKILNKDLLLMKDNKVFSFRYF